MRSTIAGLLSRLEDLEQRTKPSQRFVDLAVQLIEHVREGDQTVETGRVSPVYGGIWDRWLCEYSDEEPSNVIKYPVSPKQFDFLTVAARGEVHHLVIIGARRSAKSETMAIWAIIRLLLLPGVACALLFIKWRKAKEWLEEKVIPRCRPFILQYNKSPTMFGLEFINGASLRFLSNEVVDDARGGGIGSGGCDERQITKRETWDNVALSLSEAGRFYQTFENGTALNGSEFEDYIEKIEGDKDYLVERFTSFDNVFLDKLFIEDAKKYMDPRRYAQEVLAESVPQFATVYYPFDKQTHVQPVQKAKVVLTSRYGIYDGAGTDITSRVLGHYYKKSVPYLIGMDFNVAPMCAIVYKIFSAPPGVQDIFWGIEEVVLEEKADATQIALELKRRGFFPAVVIPDASGRHSQGGRSSHRMLLDEGFAVFAPSKNPPIHDRINSVNAKLQNKLNQVTLLFDPKCKSTIRAFLSQKIDPKTNKPEKDLVHEHRLDAAGYPIAYMCPAAYSLLERKVMTA